MLPLYRKHRCIPVLSKFQLPRSVDHEKTAKHLSNIEQHIAVCLNIIIRIDRQVLCPVRKSLDRCPVLSQHYLTGRTAEHHKIISVTDGFQRSESLLESHHVIIGLDLQALRFPVRLRHLEDSHRNFFIAAALHLQVIEQLHLRVFQRVPVDLREQGNPHLCSIHRSQFDLRGAAALRSDISAALYHIILIKLINRSGSRCDPAGPEIFSCIRLHCFKEGIAHWIHSRPP